MLRCFLLIGTLVAMGGGRRKFKLIEVNWLNTWKQCLTLYIRLKISNTEEDLIPSNMERSMAMAMAIEMAIEMAMTTRLSLTWFRQNSRRILTCARKSSQLVMLTTLYGIIQILFKDKWEALHFYSHSRGGLRLVFVPLFNMFFLFVFL